jgi:hypothetical protein
MPKGFRIRLAFVSNAAARIRLLTGSLHFLAYRHESGSPGG